MRATDLEIMERLQSRANACGKRMNLTHKIFFLRLDDYAIYLNDVVADGLRIFLSEEDMAGHFDK